MSSKTNPSRTLKMLLNIGDPVYATLIAENGTGFVERCIVIGLHDEHLKLYSLDSDCDMIADRERVITVKKMRELRQKAGL